MVLEGLEGVFEGCITDKRILCTMANKDFTAMLVLHWVMLFNRQFIENTMLPVGQSLLQGMGGIFLALAVAFYS